MYDYATALVIATTKTPQLYDYDDHKLYRRWEIGNWTAAATKLTVTKLIKMSRTTVFAVKGVTES